MPLVDNSINLIVLENNPGATKALASLLKELPVTNNPLLYKCPPLAHWVTGAKFQQ
jgi:hypothetical protein